MKLEMMEDLYVEELRDLYDAERQLLKVLPEMAKAASAAELREALEAHVQQTEGQVNRLEEVFEDLGESGRGHKCKAMAGLIEEAQDFLGEEADPEIKDAGLITNAQKMAHYEIASYGSACAHANVLGLGGQVELLDEALVEEEETDEKLNLVAEGINLEAAEGGIRGSADGQ